MLLVRKQIELRSLATLHYLSSVDVVNILRISTNELTNLTRCKPWRRVRGVIFQPSGLTEALDDTGQLHMQPDWNGAHTDRDRHRLEGRCHTAVADPVWRRWNLSPLMHHLTPR
ncbi:hypothetical protein DPEC_G00198300 [Dallia pectoralis]|uniref:Uncharacterized protein n=1 Tax=Dallia pectoralis TaxID=75939 RepID=A0ACC2G8B1_DALPE|nr:hypothetical protein DPEC_G00198300 [Dallia pectoralis]